MAFWLPAVVQSSKAEQPGNFISATAVCPAAAASGDKAWLVQAFVQEWLTTPLNQQSLADGDRPRLSSAAALAASNLFWEVLETAFCLCRLSEEVVGRASGDLHIAHSQGWLQWQGA